MNYLLIFNKINDYKYSKLSNVSNVSNESNESNVSNLSNKISKNKMNKNEIDDKNNCSCTIYLPNLIKIFKNLF